MTLQDHVELDPTPGDRVTSPVLVYFIPGNPGHVEYYRHFLTQVRDNLEASGKRNVVVYGASHDGFSSNPTPDPDHGHPPPFSLQEIIGQTQQKVSEKARELAQNSATADPIQVVLIGHSVGAYILLEVVSWWQQEQQAQKYFRIVGGVGLFPTVVDIAKSEKGRSLSWLLTISFMPSIAAFAAGILATIPLWLWNWPKTLTPGEKLASHTAVTEAVIRSPNGARQTLFMAADEMREIKEDKWHPANLWGVRQSEVDLCVGESTPRTKLFFYWGQDDYWVDNNVRDKFITKRARRPEDDRTAFWPEMIVDTHFMDHCFSLNRRHSRIVAQQAGEWIAQLTIA